MNSTLGAIAIFIIIVYVLRWYFNNDGETKVPGPKGLPWIGSGLQVKPDKIHEQFYEFAKQYGDMFRIQIFGSETLVLNSAELVHKAFTKYSESFNHRGNAFIINRIGLRESISFRGFDKEHRVSKKAFVKSLHVYGSGMTVFEGIVQRELTRLVGAIDGQKGKEFEVTGMMRRSITNIISILLIGEEATEEQDKLFTEITSGEDFFLGPGTNTLLTNLPFLIHLPYYKRRLDATNKAKRTLQDYFYRAAKDETINKGGFVRGLIENKANNPDGEYMTDEMIKHIILTDVLTAGKLFTGGELGLSEGHFSLQQGIITTSSALPTTILCLVDHPELQRKLQAELDEKIGRDRRPTVDDRHACSFTEAVILETMRYVPVGVFTLPHACKKDVEFEGYRIKANTQILVNLWYIHHDEAHWGDPWNFRPERFLDENGELLPSSHPYRKSYLMFGTGARMCPGMGMALTRLFLYVATLFQKYTLVPSPGKCGSSDPRCGDYIFELITKPKPFYVVARER